MKEAFDQENIEIPFPHMTLYTGSVTDPFPISFTSEGKKALNEGKQ